jgi:hypothetical protein
MKGFCNEAPRVKVYVTVLAFPKEDNATMIAHARCAAVESLLNYMESASTIYFPMKKLPKRHNSLVFPHYEFALNFCKESPRAMTT